MASPAVAVLLAVCGVLLLAACGEPAVDVSIPERDGDRAVLDLAGILSEDVERRLQEIRAEEGLDMVALTYESAQAGAGEARRAGQALVSAWDADIALVAVAEEGHFTGGGEDRRRFFGLEPADQFSVPRSLRERIVEDEIIPIAARDDWDEVFLHTAETLARELP